MENNKDRLDLLGQKIKSLQLQQQQLNTGLNLLLDELALLKKNMEISESGSVVTEQLPIAASAAENKKQYHASKIPARPAKYHDFSSVIMSGGITILYFITFIAYNFYNLVPQSIAFMAMVAITVFAVRMAVWYNRKIIALLGQVGAYAVPFLLSDGSGKVLVLFSYITIINIGLLILSVKKDWKIIYQAAFLVSWLIYIFTISVSASPVTEFSLRFFFLVINFIIFYTAFLSYKIVSKELYVLGEVMILLINAFVFFLVGYAFIKSTFPQNQYLTFFTLINAGLHIAAALWIRKMKLLDHTVSVFMLGLGISFITISIPVSLSQNWITLLWAVEATVLCYTGYRSKRNLYLIASFVVLMLTLSSLSVHWMAAYNFLSEYHVQVKVDAFLNFKFFISLTICCCIGIMSWMAAKNEKAMTTWISHFFRTTLPFVFIGLLYLNLFLEIQLWWDENIHQYHQSENFSILSLLIYSMLYVSVWLLLNLLYYKNKYLAGAMMAAALLITVVMLTDGLNAIGEMRSFYINRTDASVWMISARYICCMSLACLLVLVKKNQPLYSHHADADRLYSSLLNIVLLTMICNEFIHWMDMGGFTHQYKLGLSIICGLYALALVTAGILKKRKHLRIGAIILLAATLIKLLFYDLASLSTVSKTIVLIILGIILLIASFLYNKFKQVLFEEIEEDNT